MINIHKITEDKTLGEIFKVDFHDKYNFAREASKKNLEIISAKDLAVGRMNADLNDKNIRDYLIDNGGYVKEGLIYTQGKSSKIYLISESLEIAKPKQLIKYVKQNHFSEPNFVGDKFNIDSYLEEIGKNNYITINARAKHFIRLPTNRFADCEITKFLFKEHAQQYGLWIKNMGNISTVSIILDKQDTINQFNRPYSTMVRINGLCIFPEDYLKKYSQNNYTSITGDRTVNKTFTDFTAKNKR